MIWDHHGMGILVLCEKHMGLNLKNWGHHGKFFNGNMIQWKQSLWNFNQEGSGLERGGGGTKKKSKMKRFINASLPSVVINSRPEVSESWWWKDVQFKTKEKSLLVKIGGAIYTRGR